MPIVPRVSPAPLPGVRVSGDVSDAAFGGGAGNVVAGIQPGLSAVHSEAAQIAQEEKVRADQIALTDAGGQASGAMNDVLYGPDGALTTHGAAAFGTPETTRAAYYTRVGQIRANLGNDDQRDAFDRIVANDWSRIDEQVQRHVAQQRQVYDTQSTAAAVGNAQNLAIQGYDQPQIVESQIQSIRSETQAYGARNGWSDDQTKEMTDQSVSDTRFGVLSRMLDNGQDADAATYFQAHRDELQGPQLVQAEKLVMAGSLRGTSQRRADQITTGRIPGLLTPGNIDLANRPRVTNADGTISTVRSISIERDGHDVLIPTVSDDGRVLTNDEATAQYDRTGQQLGVFSTVDAADTYAEQLHEAQAAMIAGRGTGTPPGAALNLRDALAQTAQIADPQLRDATEVRVRRYYDDQAAADRQDRDAAFTQASAILEQTKDADQIPLAIRQKLTPEENDALDHREDQLRHPKTLTNLSVYTHLLNLSALNDGTRAQFMNTDLSQYRGQLSDEDYKHLLGLQRSARLGEDRTEDSATRRTREREETSVIKAADQASKAGASIDMLRSTLKASGKSDAEVEQSVSALRKAQPAARVVVPQWMLDSAAHDPEYADYLRAHNVPLAAATADSSAAPAPASAPSPAAPPAQSPQRPKVAGAPMPKRSAFNPGAFGLSPQP